MTIQRETPAIPPQKVSLKAPVKDINITWHPQQSIHQNHDGSYLLFESSILPCGQWLMPANLLFWNCMDLLRVTPIKWDFEESGVGELKLLLNTLVTFIGKLSPLGVAYRHHKLLLVLQCQKKRNSNKVAAFEPFYDVQYITVTLSTENLMNLLVNMFATLSYIQVINTHQSHQQFFLLE